ncbi:MAG: hypothetical protein JST42_15040 [Bacteroidetes bacterium]|nr:hypothetical protein [Bacteroidota bacterium]
MRDAMSGSKMLLLAFVPVLLPAIIAAQGVFSNKTQVVLEKVIQDYPNHFHNIKGELIGQAEEAACYRSTLQLPGAASSTVTLSISPAPAGSGWVCVVLNTENFETAKRRYAEIYAQLSNSIITSGNQKTFILSGQYEAPAEDRKTSRVTFSLLPGVGEMKNLKVELSLLEAEKGWKILLSVQDKDLKDLSQVAMGN